MTINLAQMQFQVRTLWEATENSISVYTGGAVDADAPAFGGIILGMTRGSANSIVGAVRNNSAANTDAYPTGVTGFGRTDSAGNQAFGLFGRADLYSTGVVTNEMNSFNYSAAPSAALPPNRAIGTTERHPIALTVAAGGDYNSSIGIHIVREGSEPRSFLTGIYFNPDSVTTTGTLISAAGGGSFGYGIDLSGSSFATSALKLKVPDASTGVVFDSESGATNGSNLRLSHTGASNPHKHIRAINGSLEVVNSAYSAVILALTDAGILTLAAPVTLKGYTVAGLPAGVTGHVAYVTDALAPAFLTAVVGGGAVKAPVFYDGTNWVAI